MFTVSSRISCGWLGPTFLAVQLVACSDTNENMANFDTFIAKLDASGSPLWAKGFGGPSSFDQAKRIHIDNVGNVIFSGDLSETFDLGSGAQTSAGGTDIIAAKFSSSGAPLWATRMGGINNDSVWAATVDFGNGMLLDAGTFVTKITP